MSRTSLATLILERLLAQYGPFLTYEDVATELRIDRSVLYNRRSRGRTGGMPPPDPKMRPIQFRATDLAEWFSGQELEEPPNADRVRRPVGRPRKTASSSSDRAAAGR